MLTQPPASLGFAADKSSTALSIPDADGDGNVEYPEARHEIENGVHQLETLLEATVDKDFDKFEIFALRSILSVPEELRGWIRLSHYEVRELHAGFYAHGGWLDGSKEWRVFIICVR